MRSASSCMLALDPACAEAVSFARIYTRHWAAIQACRAAGPDDAQAAVNTLAVAPRFLCRRGLTSWHDGVTGSRRLLLTNLIIVLYGQPADSWEHRPGESECGACTGDHKGGTTVCKHNVTSSVQGRLRGHTERHSVLGTTVGAQHRTHT
jgi:hypothetical protein